MACSIRWLAGVLGTGVLLAVAGGASAQINMHAVIDQHRTRILAIAKRHGIREVRVFGSMARGDADDNSDVDLLVSLPPERTGLALGGLLMDVQELLHRRVEVVTERSLHPDVLDRVLNEAQPL